MRGKKGPKCCGKWNQPCRCPKPCTRRYNPETKKRDQACQCAACDCK